MTLSLVILDQSCYVKRLSILVQQRNSVNRYLRESCNSLGRHTWLCKIGIWWIEMAWGKKNKKILVFWQNSNLVPFIKLFLWEQKLQNWCRQAIYKVNRGLESLRAKSQTHKGLSKKGQTHFYNVSVFSLSFSILFMSIWARILKNYYIILKIVLKWSVFTTLIWLELLYFSVQSFLNMVFEDDKGA